MSLATRCTACGTVFRVVQDQLRVSNGWVRCGRCSEVFDAGENLVDAPLQASAAAIPDADTASAAETAADADIVVDPDQRAERSDAERPATAPAPPTEVDSAAPGADPHAPGATSAPLPSFLRQADRAARWRRPRVRTALAAAALVSTVGLAAQVAHSWRDLVAARWPATTPLLSAAGRALGCTLGPPRLIDALVVESSGLLRVERSALYRLSVSLRNREAHAIAVPAVDLTLTDTRGRVIARRALRPEELGAAGTGGAPAGRELLLQATLQARTDTPGQVVAGYTIELFYP